MHKQAASLLGLTACHVKHFIHNCVHDLDGMLQIRLSEPLSGMQDILNQCTNQGAHLLWVTFGQYKLLPLC